MKGGVFIAIEEVITRQHDFLALLTEREHATFAALRVGKRKSDWLAGRVAAKMAVQSVTGAPLSTIEIKTVEDGAQSGRPFVDGLFLSITHSGDIAAATASTRPVGLDVEVVEHRPELLGIAFSPDELPVNPSCEQVTLAWCQKEAFAKLLGIGFRAAFTELRLPEGLDATLGTFSHNEVSYAWTRLEGEVPKPTRTKADLRRRQRDFA